MYLTSFTLPNEDTEYSIARARMAQNGGPDFGYLENGYPCGIFPKKGLETVHFGHITIFYGGNGSGKSTLLNIIAQKLEPHRVSPYLRLRHSPRPRSVSSAISALLSLAASI